jgi:hypothetical protein
MTYPYLEQSLRILNPWVINLDSDPSNEIDNLSKEQVDPLLRELFLTEQNMAAIAIDRRQWDLAEVHCRRCLAYSRRYGLEEGNKITMIFEALRHGNYSDAVTFAEECYNLVVTAYDPVHPQVQETAGILIEILNKKGDLFDAERYAHVTYGNLWDKKNGIDQESEAVAEGAYNLTEVIYQQKRDLIKAEELAREYLRIRTQLYGNNHEWVGRSCNLLAGILTAQGKLGDRTRGLYERYLVNSIRNSGPDGSNTANANCNLGLFSIAVFNQLACEQTTIGLQQPQLLLTKLHSEEALRIHSKMYGPTHPDTAIATAQLAIIPKELS